MSDNEDTQETPVVQEPEIVELPPQQSATDTTNRDNKVSVDPNGEKYIRAEEE